MGGGASALDDVQKVPEAEYQDCDQQTHHQERNRLLAHHRLNVFNHVYSSQGAALAEGYAGQALGTRSRNRRGRAVLLPTLYPR
jgi:hypothetical protein